MRKSTLALTLCLVFISLLSVRCSKDKDNNIHNIDALIGSFKGTINTGDEQYFDAVITITKVSDGQVKVAPKSGEAYSDLTAKSIKVTNPVGVTIVGGDEQGSISYIVDTKALTLSTNKTAATDKDYLFTGSKQ